MHMKTVVLSLASLAFAAYAETPDFFGDRLVSDGIGFVDTGYMYVYHENDGVKTRTSKVEMSFYTLNYGHGEAPGPVTESSTRTILGYQDGTGKSWLRYDGTGRWAQLAYATSISTFTAPAVSNNQLTIDYEAEKLTWGSVEHAADASKADATRSYYAFAMNHATAAYRCPGVLELETLSFYERVGDAAETEVHRFRPCYKDGHPALYDEITQTIAYPTTDGFLLSGVDMTVAENARIAVNSSLVNLRALSLAAGAELAFDEPVTLSPESEVELPESGVVTVSLPQQHGWGRYVLIDNLPTDFALDRFAIGQLPPACAGTLSREGASLVLTIASDGRVWPEALAETLSSDGAGYVDLGYQYRTTGYPKTSRITCDFYAYRMGRGTPPGPTTTSGNRTIFGYQESSSTSMSIARYTGDKVQFYYKDGGNFSAWCDGQGSHIDLDYLNGNAFWSWKDGKENISSNVPAPAVDAAVSYYLFANNCYNRSTLYPSVIDFRSLRIYETSDGVTETLAHDYVPCMNAGRYGVYDREAGAIRTVQNDTNCFSVANATWRLTVNGEVFFCTGGQTFAAGSATAPDGWLLIRDRDGALIEKGVGTTASFEMPEVGASLVWTHDETIAAAGTRTFVGLESAAALTVGADATLAFAQDAQLVLSDGLILPTDGTVNVSRAGVDGEGAYLLVRGVSDSLDLSRLVAVGLPEGLKGSVERQDDALVLRVAGVSAAQAALPDRMLDSLTGDGVGYFDTGYKYRAESLPKTARVVCKFDGGSWGRGFAGGPMIPETQPNRTIFGYQESSSERCSVARYNNYKAFFSYKGGTVADWNGNGSTTVEIDYLAEAARWAWKSASEDSACEFSSVTAPTDDTDFSYYLFANNCYDRSALNRSVIRFQSLEFYESSDGETATLARQFLPAVKDGRPCIYDPLTKTLCMAISDTNGFAFAGASWPTSVYAAPVVQDFAYVRTVSPRPVSVPAFAPETEYVLMADAHVTVKQNLQTARVTFYDRDGTVTGSDIYSSLRAGEGFDVTVATAAKAVLALSGVEDRPGEVAQHFDLADTVSGDKVLFRQLARRRFEFMISADSTFTFLADIASVQADSYDATGIWTGTETLSGACPAGSTLEIPVSDAVYRIVRVTLPAPGLMLMLR